MIARTRLAVRTLTLALVAGCTPAACLSADEASGEQEQVASDLTVEEIVERYAEARGGWERIKAIRTLQWRGQARDDDLPVPVMTKKRPYYFVIGEVTDDRDYAEGNDGSPWEYYANPGLVLRTSAAPAAATRHTAYFDNPLLLSGKPGWSRELLGETRFADVDAYHVRVTHPDGFGKDLFLDKETFLVIGHRITAPVHAFGDPITSETRVSDYVDVAGVLYPLTLEEYEIGTDRRLTGGSWASITANLDFPDAYFSPPDVPNSPLARMLNAAYSARAIPANSLGWFREFIEDPGNAGIDVQTGLESVGYQCLKNGAVETGVLLLEYNLELHPESPSALFNLGRAYRTADRETEAVELFERALEIEPGYPRAVEALKD